MLFSNQSRHQVSLPATDSSGQPSNLGFLVDYLINNLMRDPRKEMFVMDGTV